MPDPQFIDKVRDIVGLYLNPPDAAVVLCVDEKSQIQRVLPGEAQDELPELRVHRRSPRSSPSAVGPLAPDELTMPPEQRLGPDRE